MRYILMILFLFGITNVSFSQTGNGICATDGNFPDVLKSTNQRTQSSARIANSCFYTVRVFFHLVRNTDGTGGQDVGVINTIMTNLTNAYTPHSIFFLNGGNDEIRNSYYMTAFDSQVKFSQLIAVNSVSNAINIYLLDNNTFNAGKASGIPGNSLVVGGTYSLNGVVQNLVPSLVVAHELGHCLGAYHTFETLNGQELVNGSNCTTAGDLVCDTPAESPNYNFTENATCNWTSNFTDSNGQTYSPALNNIMDYIRPSCMQLFTSGQGTRMRSVLSSSAVFDNIIVDPIINGPSTICSSGNSNLSINNLPVGFNVTWSSNPSGISFNPTTGNVTTPTRINNFNGQATITATLSGGCGNVIITRTVWVGNPDASNSTLIYPSGYRGVDPVTLCSGCTYNFMVDFVAGASSYTWVLPSGFSFVSGRNSSTPGIKTATSNGTYVLYCSANNSCGSSWTHNLTINIGGGGQQQRIAVYPNPTSTELTIESTQSDLTISNNSTTDTSFLVSNETFSAKLFDQFSLELLTGESKNGRIVFDVRYIQKGIYYLHVMRGQELIIRQIVIDK